MKTLNSIFDIGGNDEKALTKAFGVILRRDKTLFNKFLSSSVPKLYNRLKISKKDFDAAIFSFEKRDSHGRTDIEIKYGKAHLIIESKIGTNEVKLEQAERYATRLEEAAAEIRVFIFLTEIGNLSIDKQFKKSYPKISFANLSWESTLKLMRERGKIEIDLVEEYERYLLGSQNMKIHDIDIWAVVVKGAQKENFDKHNFYRTSKKHKPILVGKREWDKELKKVVIKKLRPVIDVLDKNSPEGKKNGNYYVYKLGKEMVLEKPIIKKFPPASAIALNFKDL